MKSMIDRLVGIADGLDLEGFPGQADTVTKLAGDVVQMDRFRRPPDEPVVEQQTVVGDIHPKVAGILHRFIEGNHGFMTETAPRLVKSQILGRLLLDQDELKAMAGDLLSMASNVDGMTEQDYDTIMEDLGVFNEIARNYVRVLLGLKERIPRSEAEAGDIMEAKRFMSALAALKSEFGSRGIFR